MLDRPASLAVLMDELTNAEQAINDVLPADFDRLEVHKWRPTTIDPPTLYNNIGSAPLMVPDTGTLRDTVTVLTRIAIQQATSEQEWGPDLEVFSDAFREVMDPLLMQRGRPLNGACLKADRTDFRTVVDTFADIDYLAMEFVLSFRLERAVPIA